MCIILYFPTNRHRGKINGGNIIQRKKKGKGRKEKQRKGNKKIQILYKCVNTNTVQFACNMKIAKVLFLRFENRLTDTEKGESGRGIH